MTNSKIILLAGKGITTNILYHSLKNDFPVTAILLEEPVSKKEFLKKRIKKLGLLKVTGQILFQVIIVKLLPIFSAKRMQKIMNNYQMDKSELPEGITIRLKSVNEETCIKELQKINPDLVIVNGTRIISKKVLECINSRFINIHAGYTPMYRGVHGAYWALVNNDKARCGVTVHLVDSGIDTGGVISQKLIPLTPEDNFVTYPLLQLGEGILLIKKAIIDLHENDTNLIGCVGKSKLWYHPGIFQYLYHRIFNKIK